MRHTLTTLPLNPEATKETQETYNTVGIVDTGKVKISIVKNVETEGPGENGQSD